MHSEAAKGSLHRAIVVTALLTLGSGCTLLPATGTASPTSSTSPATTPTQSPSPSPSASATTQLLATSPLFHGGEVGVVYSPVSLQVTGGAAPYAWSVSSGSVPNGLSLSSDGQVAGTPTKAGHFTFIATVAAMLFYSGGLGGNGNLGFQVSGWTTTCDFTGCGPPPAPTGSAAQGGVYIVVPGSSGGNGYHAYFTLTLNDGHLCGAGTYCSAAATVNVVVQAG